jgi:hypothetical protein
MSTTTRYQERKFNKWAIQAVEDLKALEWDNAAVKQTAIKAAEAAKEADEKNKTREELLRAFDAAVIEAAVKQEPQSDQKPVAAAGADMFHVRKSQTAAWNLILQRQRKGRRVTFHVPGKLSRAFKQKRAAFVSKDRQEGGDRKQFLLKELGFVPIDNLWFVESSQPFVQAEAM